MAKFKVSQASSLAKIQTLNCPKLIAHGTLDDYLPFSDGQKIFAAAAMPKQFFPIEQAHHANMLTLNVEKLHDRIVQFVNQ
jgi:fermentation-respiration switch protein FrsA (DUF1100 family)